MSNAELVYLAPSPFSHRAKWALDAAGVEYITSPYPFSPFYIQELPLRWRIGNTTGKITAPILIVTDSSSSSNGHQVIMDSTQIARWAGQNSNSAAASNLFPKEREEELNRWVVATDELLSLCRKGLAAAGLNNAAVIDALLPKGLSGISIMIARTMMRLTFQKIGKKYGDQDAAAEAQQVTSHLKAAQQQISSNPNKLLLPTNGISFADIALASAINWIAGWSKVPLPGHSRSSSAPTKLSSEAAGDAAADPPDDGGQKVPEVTDLGGNAAQSVASLVPEFQMVLDGYGGLVEWAAETVKQYWPQAVEGQKA